MQDMQLTEKTIHLWLPNMFGFKGGIQVYSAFLLEAIQNIYPKAKYEVFLKHDVSLPENYPCLPETKFHFTGQIPLAFRSAAFATKLMLSGIQKRPNLIISSHINFTVVASTLKRIFGIPYWAVAHGVDAWDITNPTLKNALDNADRILAVSGYTRDRFVKEQNFEPKKVDILPNTFDRSRFHPAPKPDYLLQKHGLKREQPVILTVARLSKAEQYKGYDQIIKALPAIRQYIPDVRYIIVGKGDDRPRIEQLIAELGMEHNVTLAGFVADEQLCDYYNLCDVFAMPSKGEGFGIVYLEALACGKPVLGGNQDGAIDALCHGELGALVNPDDTQAIAQTLIQILQGVYPHRLMYEPERLRYEVIDTYGFERFQKTLATQLDGHFQLKKMGVKS
jgi:glycosyltransferase involved in cell wall biosynthesis